jgi:D-beta-D-heptose 7-phosphate kinase/D-beta-D-heptose 1-phosphate adenosyltransferase
MNADRVKTLTTAFGRQRILVVGDVMLDRYIHGVVERISPEAPVPVVRVVRERQVPGGAANVASNIRALGGTAVMAGAVGNDAAGAELRHAIEHLGIGTGAMTVIPGLRTTVKTRVIADRQQMIRVDWENEKPHSAEAVAAFCEAVERAIDDCTGVVIEDYSKGIVRQEVVDTVLGAARRKGIPVGLDPKDNLDLRIEGLTLATPNYKEAHVCAGLTPRTPHAGDPLQDASLHKAAEILMREWRPALLIVTLGPQGMYLASKDRPPRVIPTRAREVFDVSGAGDTVIATCLLALAAGATYDEAAVLGNNAAGVVVGKLGTATCSAEELLRSVETHEC